MDSEEDTAHEPRRPQSCERDRMADAIEVGLGIMGLVVAVMALSSVAAVVVGLI